LYPTTHCYNWGEAVVYGPSDDPERKALWILGSVTLSAGQHILRLTFPPMYSADLKLDEAAQSRSWFR
jgi:hypothetical protein